MSKPLPPLVEAAEPKNKKGKVTKGLEIGDTGTQIYAGIIYDEYNSKLRDARGIETYDEMRKSDGTVKAAVLATSLPIMRANWYVEPASDETVDIEIADFIQKALMDYQTITWADILRHALLCLPFGVMAFEKVFAIKTIDGVDRIIWQKFSPRMPKSIQAWAMTDGNPGIQQRTQGGKLVDIPIEKLIVFVHEKEGDNWWGNSILRAAYKHWHMKNTFYKIDAIAFERQGLGVPYVKMPEVTTDADTEKAATILKNLRANEQAYIIEPHDYEIGFKDMQGKTVRDPSASITHHNREIVKSVLAQFLELGATDSGSRALSSDQSDLFLQSLESVAKNVADSFNTYAIPELVNLNFDNVQNYPKLTYTGISRVDTKALAESYASLVTAGGIGTDPADELFFRNQLGLPERTTDREEVVEEPDPTEPNPDEDDDLEEDALEEVGLSEHVPNLKKNVFPERKEINAAINASIANLEPGLRIAFLKGHIGMFSQFASTHKHAQLFALIRGELTALLHKERKQSFDDGSTFKGYRAMTFAEKKVDFDSIEKNLDRLEDTFDSETQALLQAQREIFIAKLSKAVVDGDMAAVKEATIEVQEEYAKIIKSSMKDAYEYGKTNAAKEINQKTPSNVKAVLDQMDIQADSIAEMHISEITNSAKTVMVDALNKGETAVAAVAAADVAVAQKIIDLTTNTSRIAMAGYVNNGRASVFDSYGDKIYALQRSELLDSRTCNYCLSVDGRIIEKNDSFGKNTIFHSGCRGIWVSILLDEEELPPIGGIPSSIRDRFGDAVNDLIQPKTPITQKASAARKEQEKRLKRQAKNKKK